VLSRIKLGDDVTKSGDEVKAWIYIAGFAGWIFEVDIFFEIGIHYV
jgi:hypothetical protein